MYCTYVPYSAYCCPGKRPTLHESVLLPLSSVAVRTGTLINILDSPTISIASKKETSTVCKFGILGNISQNYCVEGILLETDQLLVPLKKREVIFLTFLFDRTLSENGRSSSSSSFSIYSNSRWD